MREEFQVHLLNAHGIERATQIGELFSRLLDEVETIVPKGRELAIVVTKLQEASFFAKRAIANNPYNQKETK